MLAHPHLRVARRPQIPVLPPIPLELPEFREVIIPGLPGKYDQKSEWAAQRPQLNLVDHLEAVRTFEKP